MSKIVVNVVTIKNFQNVQNCLKILKFIKLKLCLVKNCKNDEDKLGLILILLANGAKVSLFKHSVRPCLKLYATFTETAKKRWPLSGTSKITLRGLVNHVERVRLTNSDRDNARSFVFYFIFKRTKLRKFQFKNYPLRLQERRANDEMAPKLEFESHKAALIALSRQIRDTCQKL